MNPGLILLAIAGISVLVIVHEGGHYLVARACGMRVIRFSIGIGPTVFRYQPKDSPTVFQLCAIPFLAYVQIAGMNPHEEVDSDDPGLFPNQGLFARIATIFAGPFANYLLAAALTFTLALVGWPEHLTRPVVKPVDHTTPAAIAGVHRGDVIVEANGEVVHNFGDLIRITSVRAGKATSYVVERDGKRMPPMMITPRLEEERGVIGVTFTKHYRAYGWDKAATMALAFPYEVTVLNALGLAELFKKKTLEGLAGPVRMGKMVAESAKRGPIEYAWMLIVLSVALGMFNLLPLPALDGGRLSFLMYEMIAKRRPDARIEAVVHTVGLLFLLGLLVLVTFRDVMS
ncbi:MAG: site-2 protease family protein [Myxococcales bacterium]|nr:MAG: site-2 protease family protein [Myxococcales bacterium]